MAKTSLIKKYYQEKQSSVYASNILQCFIEYNTVL